MALYKISLQSISLEGWRQILQYSILKFTMSHEGIEIYFSTVYQN